MGGPKVEKIQQGHGHNGCDQKKNGEFAQDGGVFKGRQVESFFIAFIHLKYSNFKITSCKEEFQFSMPFKEV
jgi:hypothetical protein